MNDHRIQAFSFSNGSLNQTTGHRTEDLLHLIDHSRILIVSIYPKDLSQTTFLLDQQQS